MKTLRNSGCGYDCLEWALLPTLELALFRRLYKRCSSGTVFLSLLKLNKFGDRLFFSFQQPWASSSEKFGSFSCSTSLCPDIHYNEMRMVIVSFFLASNEQKGEKVPDFDHLCQPFNFNVQSVSAIAYPFDFRDFITITDASLYAIRSIFFLFSIYAWKARKYNVLPAWRFDKWACCIHCSWQCPAFP